MDTIGGLSKVSQRRSLVLLFIDIIQSTELAASMEPEDYAELLSNFRVVLRCEIERRGGEMIRVDGDGALCVFGLYGEIERAGYMAANAALATHNQIARRAIDWALSPITVHSGIHAGVVLLRHGDLVRGLYEVIGDATNVAARLCDAAGPNEILISEAAIGGNLEQIALSPLRSIALFTDRNGRERRLDVFAVLPECAEAYPCTNCKTCRA